MNILSGSIMVSFAGGLLALDRTAAFQFMVSRPIVAAPVVGYLLGAPLWGLVAGITLELLFIGDFPVGRYVPVHDTGLAVLAAALTVTALDSIGAPSGYEGLKEAVMVLPPVLLAAIPASRLYHMADAFTRRYNLRLYEGAFESVAGGGAGAGVSLMKYNLKGLAVFFVTNVAVLLVTVAPLMYAAHLIFSRLSLRLLPIAFAGCLLVGLAAGVNALATGRGWIIFAISAAFVLAALIAVTLI